MKLIKGWNYLTIAFALITVLFIGILVYGDVNMFTLPLTIVFAVCTTFCAQQWNVMRLFKKIEKKHPDWA